MIREQTNIVSKTIGIVVSLIGIFVILGWIRDIHPLTSVFPHYVQMKFVTALSFFFSGIVLAFMSCGKVKRASFSSLLVFIICPLLISLFMSTLFLSRIFNIRTGIEDVFIQEIGPETFENISGLPSLATMIAFMLVSMTGLMQLSYISWKKYFTRFTGYVLCIISTTATLGYIFNIPLLYFVIPDISTAIALNSAIVLNFLGFGFIIVSNGQST